MLNRDESEGRFVLHGAVFTNRMPPSTHLIAITTGRIRLPENSYVRSYSLVQGPRDGELLIRVEYSYEVSPSAGS